MAATTRVRRTWSALAVASFFVLTFLVACTAPGPRGDGPAGGAGDPSPPQTTSAGPSSGGVIAFATQKRGQVVVTRPDGSGVRELVSGSACCTVLSVDGGRLAFLTQTADDRETTATMTIDGQDRSVLTPPPGLNLVPGVWAVDGASLWLAAYSVKGGHNGVVRSAVRGGDLVWLTHPPGRQFDVPVDASADGTKLLFLRLPSSDADPFAGDLYVVPTSGGDPVRLNPSGTRAFYWWTRPGNFFPDSRRVTFVAVTGPDDKPLGRVMVAASDGSSVTPLPLGGAAPAGGTSWTMSSQVSPDGRWIAFDMWAPMENNNSVGRQGNSLFIVHPDGSGLRQLDSSPSASFGGVWSPDSARILYSVGGWGASNLRWIAIDGGESGDVTTSGGESFVDYGWAGETSTGAE